MPRGQHETQSWAVTVERDGELVVTLAMSHLAGRDLSPEDERVIRLAAEHLLAFIGANAPLNAAAPDLLAALKGTLNYWKSTGFADCEPDCDCIVEAVRAAIAKAEGG